MKNYLTKYDFYSLVTFPETMASEMADWWTVDLGKPHDVYEVELDVGWGRTHQSLPTTLIAAILETIQNFFFIFLFFFIIFSHNDIFIAYILYIVAKSVW